MRKIVKGVLGYPDTTREEIQWTLGIAVIHALREHKRLGVPIVVWDWESGRVVTLPPEEIVVPMEGYDWNGEPIPDQPVP